VNSATLVKVEGLTAGYGKVPVVRDISLQVAPGEIVTLLGANGAGKTTTLRAITGIAKLHSGSITIGDQQLKNCKVHQLRWNGVAYIPDDRSLFGSLTVSENLRMARGTRPVGELFDWFPALQSIQSRKASLLSGGEQQMLTLARALACHPKILLIDEMSAGLAPIIAESLMALLRKLADEHGIGVLLVEQHVDLALNTADRGYVLHHGVIAAQGSATKLLHNRHLLEESYLGEIAEHSDGQVQERSPITSTLNGAVRPGILDCPSS
jgi:branched-chain amino acid transport system ATP-binding protein